MSAMSEQGRWRRVELLFHAALECPLETRPAYLREACEGDEALLREVESLLGYEGQGGSLLEQPAWANLSVGSSEQVPVLAPGEKLRHYTILRPLGAGGMGQVYQARDERLLRDVALKLLHPALAADPIYMARFRREARLLASLSHPSIAALFAYEICDSTVALVLEFVRGRTLTQCLAEGPLERSQFYVSALQVVSALMAAHDKGIVHRDLKPGNIMILPSGQVKLLDFGLARQDLAGPDRTQSLRTTEGSILGSIPYMSPEQGLGRVADVRSDIFSLGVVLFEACSGRQPFRRETALRSLSALIHDDPPPLSTLCKDAEVGLAEFIARCLAKDPQARPASMAEVMAELRRLERWREEPPFPHITPGVRRPRTAWMAAAVLALVSAVGWYLAAR